MKKGNALIGTLVVMLLMFLSGSARGANYFSGSSAGVNFTSGDGNAVVGDYAAQSLISGSYNVAVGELAGNTMTSASRNVFVGSSAGPNINADGVYDTVAVGYYAGQSLNGGNNNTFVGSNAGLMTYTGELNTYIGNGAGTYNSTGFRNIFVGNSAGAHNYYGDHNIFIGDHAGDQELVFGEDSYRLYIAPTGTASPLIYGEFDNNKLVINGDLTVTGRIINAGFAGLCDTYLGDFAGQNDDGSYNTFVGANAGRFNTTGTANTYIGKGAGYANSTGSGNVFLGNAAGFFETGSNKLYIANNAFTPLIYGEFDNKIVKINGTLVMASDERLKRNIEPLISSLEDLMRLRGVSYELKEAPQEGRGFGGKREVGLIAQEVERILPELVLTGSNGFKSVAYEKLVPVLIEALKEQEKKIAGQRDRIQEKNKEIEMLEGALEAIEKRLGISGLPLKTAALK